MASKHQTVPDEKYVAKIMGIAGLVLLVMFVVAMFIMNYEPSTSSKVKLPAGFSKVQKVTVELDVKDRGIIRLELRNDLMPKTTKRFCQKVLDGSYNGRIFFDADNYTINAGSPTDNGYDYKGIKMEINEEMKADRYSLLMAKDPKTNLSSQSIFLITKAKRVEFNGQYSIFGKVVDVASENVIDSVKKNDVITTAKIVSLDGKPYSQPTLPFITQPVSLATTQPPA